MSKITRFEDLECWQLSRELVNTIYEITHKQNFEKDFILKDQVRRAAISCMTNIAEGFTRYSRKEFIRFLDISSASATEIKSLLYIALDRKYITESEFEDINNWLQITHKKILGFIKYLRQSEKTSLIK